MENARKLISVRSHHAEQERLAAMAAELGYSLIPIDKGDDSDDGASLVMLVHDETGAKPFGAEFKSPDQIEKYLENIASGEIDAGDDEDGINVIDDVAFDQLLHELPESCHAEATRRRNAGEKVTAIARSYGVKPKRRIAPPTKAKMRKALGDHPEAGHIGKLVDHEQHRPGKAEQDRQRAIDDLTNLLNSSKRHELSKDELARLSTKLSDLLKEDERANDAKHGLSGKAPPLDLAELARREEQRKKRAHANANHIFTRTSRLSNFDGASTTDEARRMQKELRDDDANFLRPDDGPAYAMPKPPSMPAVQSKRETARRGHGAAPADALAAIKEAAKKRLLAESGPQIKASIAAENFVEAGRLLEKVKVAAGHGGLGPWLKTAGINERTARRCMERYGRQNGQ